MNKFTRWLPLLFWMAAIFYVSGRPHSEVSSFESWDLPAEKGAHFLAYSFFALLAWWGAMGRKRPFQHNSTRAYLSAFIITLLYAISDEIHQSFVPTRHGKLLDVLIDTLGAVTMLLVLRWWIGKQAKKKERMSYIAPLE